MAESLEGLALADSKTARSFLIFEVAELSWVKPACDGWISEGISASLLAIILERSLDSRFSKEIRW